MPWEIGGIGRKGCCPGAGAVLANGPAPVGMLWGGSALGAGGTSRVVPCPGTDAGSAGKLLGMCSHG